MIRLFSHIQQLILAERNPMGVRRKESMKELHSLSNAWLLVNDDLIMDFGYMPDLAEYLNVHEIWPSDEVNCSGRMIIPAFADSHTHLVFAATREQEFVDKINGLTYEQIAARGGGILNSAEKLAKATEEELLESALRRVYEVMQTGTGAIEIKSGYGLSVDGELKMLRVIQRIKEKNILPVKATFLGAHAYPTAYKNNHQAYLDLLIHELLPNIATEKLADYIDVFCETNYFTVAEMEQLLEAAAKYGLKPKVHVNQFNSIGGISAAVKHRAVSVDHLEILEQADLQVLKHSDTIATLLPGCSLFINIPFAPARKLIDEGVAVALASDYNPGSAPSGNMQLVIALACIRMKMLPEEAFVAATVNGAAAMELQHQIGTITPGKQANFIITHPISSVTYIPYAFGTNHVSSLYINGIKMI
jgi:imidazolonepropionase